MRKKTDKLFVIIAIKKIHVIIITELGSLNTYVVPCIVFSKIFEDATIFGLEG